MKQAVVVIHGMGEQIPMQTLQSFVETVWVNDLTLIDMARPDSATGGDRKNNAIWGKPDERNRSYELRRLTTESLPKRGATDFYEFYWAHLMHGTSWEHFKAWLFDLLLRSPRRVPKGVRGAWVLLWAVSLISAAGALIGLTLASATNWLAGLATGLLSLGVGAFVEIALLKYFGDVARYVKASPLNVARRQEIREKGVELLETLMGTRPGGGTVATEYDRIIVVAHSLGAIIAYDILSHCFARLNTKLEIDGKSAAELRQPERARMEAMVRQAGELLNGAAQASSVKPMAWDLEAFQQQQARCLAELNAQGNPWIVSDFVTLGSPLAHAEFLLAIDKEDLRSAQERRILPTCPPTLEFDGTTKLSHFSYRAGGVAKIGDSKDPETPRLPHHAALFAYTRWTNLYSPHKKILWGDIVSGPAATVFNLSVNGREVIGIRDIAVMPESDARDAASEPRPTPFFSHGKYWRMDAADVSGIRGVPHHVRELRKALKLKDG